jgi:hypothetical protein
MTPDIIFRADACDRQASSYECLVYGWATAVTLGALFQISERETEIYRDDVDKPIPTGLPNSITEIFSCPPRIQLNNCIGNRYKRLSYTIELLLYYVDPSQE